MKKNVTTDYIPTRTEKVKRRQRDIMRADILARDHDVNEVLWNGSSGGSCIQRIGAFIVGASLFLSGFGAMWTTFQHRVWIGALLSALIALGGARIVYMNWAKSGSHNGRSRRWIRESQPNH